MGRKTFFIPGLRLGLRLGPRMGPRLGPRLGLRIGLRIGLRLGLRIFVGRDFQRKERKLKWFSNQKLRAPSKNV